MKSSAIGIWFRKTTNICFIRSTTKRPNNSKMSGMLVAPAVERNKDPILDVLKQYYDKDFNGKVLEIASGTGGHVIYFSQYFHKAIFQPSDLEPRSLHSIVAYVDHYRPENVRVPLFIDVTLPPDRWALPADFGPNSIDLIFNANMIHISSNKAVSGLFKATQGLLKSNGRLITYGPYGFDGKIYPESNQNFDKSLRSQNSEWGIRQVDDLCKEAQENGLRLVGTHSMPANNHTLVFVRTD